MSLNHHQSHLLSAGGLGKSAFSLISGTRADGTNKEKNENVICNANQTQLALNNSSKLVSSDGEIWQPQQIGRLFSLYDIYGPQWKVMSLQMVGRTANNLKNRFYTVLRNLVKLLFRKCPQNCPRLPGEIPSKDLCRLYDGKQDYLPFASLLSTILSEMEFNLESENFGKIVEKYSSQIQAVYHTIYGQRALPAGQHSQMKNQIKGLMFPTCSSLARVEDVERNEETLGVSIPNNPDLRTREPHQQMVYLVFFNPSDLYFSNRP